MTSLVPESSIRLGNNDIENTIRAALRIGVGDRQLLNNALPWERTGNGSLKKSFKNAMISLQALQIQAQRNTFGDKIFLSNMKSSTRLPADHVGPLTDNAVNLIRKMIQDEVRYDPGKEMLLDAIKSLAEEARYNPIEDWFGSLRWDGRRRLRDWLPRLTGAPDTRLLRKAGAVLIFTMVIRARFPGSKADLCLVLEGEQGCGKSSLLSALASAPGEGYFADAPGLVAMDNKSRAEIIAGKWLVELAELSGLARSETEGVKAFLSQCSDQYRPPYAAVAIDRPRTCIFVATTNALTYLPDTTGNRRFLPIPCSKINLKTIRAERDQLFAEAQAIVDRVIRRSLASGKVQPGHALPQDLARKFTLPPNLWSEAAALAEDRRVLDPIEEALPDIVSMLENKSRDQLSDGRTFIRSANLLDDLRFAVKGKVTNHGLAGWMKKLGWASVKYGRGAGQMRGYAK
jgi:hypothetical protein